MSALRVNVIRDITVNAIKPNGFDKFFEKVQKDILDSARKGRTFINVNLDCYSSDFVLPLSLKLKSLGFTVIEPQSSALFNVTIKWD